MKETQYNIIYHSYIPVRKADIHYLTIYKIYLINGKIKFKKKKRNHQRNKPTMLNLHNKYLL